MCLVLRAFPFLLFSAIGSVVGDELSAPMGQGPIVSRDGFRQLDVSCEADVGFVECVSDGTASEPSKSDDGFGFVRESMLLSVGCSSISDIMTEQFDVERSAAIVHVAEAVGCETLAVGVFSTDDF